ncbi:YfhO family protein [Tenacibaculum geojense]|uniref:YfhO family protein n=1 Tax=Tenacibaculum geojense TaxID=915352 RepID=A0ABW3JQR1_9FLAO
MNFKKYLPYVIAMLIFVIASIVYFNPILSGKKIKQSDIVQFSGMSKEIVDFRAENNEEPYWLGNAFSGMPAYQVSAYYPNDLVRYLDKAVRFLPRPADYLFLYFISFFVLLLALNVHWRVAIVGSLAFGFSTYLIIIFGAGHNAKAHAIGYMPLVIAGFVYIFKQRYLLGFVITALAMALEIYANHPQMTYYLGFTLLILGIVEFISALQKKVLPKFAKQVAVILLAVIIGVGANAPRLLAMKEYTAFSTRGKSELTINPDGSPKQASNGLDKEYITQYSYGIAETFNLFIPRFMGGGTVEKLDENSNFYQFLETNIGRKGAKENANNALTYWGKQPIVEAPAYIGAVLIFLFFLGAIIVRGKIKKWLVAATIFSIVLSWGKNFGLITNLFIDYVPLYNKFRAVSSIQVIAELCIPLLGILGLQKMISSSISSEEKIESLKKAFIITGGIALLFMLTGGALFAFEGIRDENYKQLPGLLEALIEDRKAMLFSDSLRSLLLVTASSGVLWMLLQNKLKEHLAILLIGGLIVFDLVSVDIKYVNKEDFVRAKNVSQPFSLTKADQQILQDTTHYRVANFTTDPMQDGRTSYYHKSIGGYHAAKMKRYQELFDYQLAKSNYEVLHMLNTKYLIVGEDKVEVNPDANGNAWFVNKLLPVSTANEEILALDTINTKEVAVIRKEQLLETPSLKQDSLASISLKKYSINELIYESSTNSEQFAVFSEVFYKKGWNAYVDGELTPHYQVNYVLRGMFVPEGNHTIVYKFEPEVITQGKAVSLFSYALLLLLPIGWIFYQKKK